MPRVITDAAIDVYQPGADEPHVTVPADDLVTAEVTYRIQAWKDQADFTINNTGGTYVDEITTGDKLVFTANDIEAIRYADTEGTYGRSRYGESTHGGAFGDRAIDWVGVSSVPTITESAGEFVEMDVEANGFVGSVLSFRKPFITYDGREIAEDGTNETSQLAIVNDLASRYAKEIDRSGIGDITTTTSRSITGENLLDVFKELAEVGDAVMSAEGETLVFRQKEGLIQQFRLTERDYDVLSVSGSDTDLANHWRLVGGQDTDLDESQETISSTFRVTESDRLTYPLDPEKNKIKFVSLYTQKDSNSKDGLRVRVQRANGDNTGPRDPANDRADLDNAQLSHEFIEQDGWIDKGFQFRQNTLPNNPWLIVDATGPDGHDIGVDGSNNPAFKTFYPYNVSTVERDKSSMNEYRERHGVRKDDDVVDFDEARQVTEALLRHNKLPTRTIEFEAKSLRAHQLQPPDMVTIDRPELGVSGKWVVVERNDNYNADGNRLHTNITLQEFTSV